MRADRRRVGVALALAAGLAITACGGSGDREAGRAARAGAPAAATGPAPAAATATVSSRRRAVVWAVGDGADGGAASKRVAARIAALGVDRLLYLGDVYEQGTAADFADHYAPVFGRFARITSPTPGNHEWPDRAAGYNAYWRARTGRTPRRWYALDVAGWRILSLNSEAPHGARSAQLRWLRAHVRGGGDCRIAISHRPRYSAGAVHGDAPDVQPFWDALRGRASLVLNGHDHDLQRFAPRAGITEFVSGAGGHGHYPLRPHAGLVFGDATHYGALRLILRRGRVAWAFVTDGGRRLDSGRLRCRP